MRILDSETRLLTPTESPAVGADTGTSCRSVYYQLTHDYLVPSLRAWLTTKQKLTLSGRAELRLTERAKLWAASSGKSTVAYALGVARDPVLDAFRKLDSIATAHDAVCSATSGRVCHEHCGNHSRVPDCRCRSDHDARKNHWSGSESTPLPCGWLWGRNKRFGRSCRPIQIQLSVRDSSIASARCLSIPKNCCCAQAEQDDVSIRRALLLAAGESIQVPAQPSGATAGNAREKVSTNFIQQLVELYQNDIDPGIHAAAEWTLIRLEKQDEIAARMAPCK